MNSDEFIFPGCENIEKKEDKKIWYWGECIKDAISVGCKKGSIEFWVVYKIRVYETHGEYRFCVAGAERLAQDIGCGVTPRQVEIALMEACQKGRLFHIWSDKRVYRNKTKIFVTKQWLEERGLTAEQIKVLSYGRNNTHKLTGKIGKNGEIIDAEIVKNESETKGKTSETKGKTSETKGKTSETKGKTSETKGKTSETKGKTLEFPHMNKCNNVCNGMCVSESSVTHVTGQMSTNTRSNETSLDKQDIQEQTQPTFSLEETNQTSDQNQTNSSINQPQDYEPKRKIPPKEKGNEKELWEQEFEELWKLYPRKESKANGLKFYLKARRKGVSKETILEGLERYKWKIKSEHIKRKYIIKGGNWFGGERWEDEIECKTDMQDKSKKDNSTLDSLWKIH